MYKIKRLKWTKSASASQPSYYAEVFDKKYSIWLMDDVWRYSLKQDDSTIILNITESLEDAKDLAQADFERRVRRYLDKI